MRAGLLSTC